MGCYYLVYMIKLTKSKIILWLVKFKVESDTFIIWVMYSVKFHPAMITIGGFCCLYYWLVSNSEIRVQFRSKYSFIAKVQKKYTSNLLLLQFQLDKIPRLFQVSISSLASYLLCTICCFIVNIVIQNKNRNLKSILVSAV